MAPHIEPESGMESRGGDERPGVEHPRGTLAIVGAYGVLFLVGWLIFYFVVFAGRGHIH
jgi:hypothetical protein